jgi:hypothetical protein
VRFRVALRVLQGRREDTIRVSLLRREHAIRVSRSYRRRGKNEKDTLAEYPILVLCLMLVAVDSLISESVSLQLVFVEFFWCFELEAENKNVLFM